jgi:hypothetical protein
MNLYANRLDVYFRKSNADISFVRDDNLRLLRKYSSFGLDVSNLKVETNPSTGQAVTTFDSTFNFQGNGKTHAGSVQSEFRWKKIDGSWKIISQKDLRIYHVNNK